MGAGIYGVGEEGPFVPFVPKPFILTCESQLDRIERKLDTLQVKVATLLDVLVEDAAEPELDLDGRPAGGERDQSKSLG